jgi:hypothetical protein
MTQRRRYQGRRAADLPDVMGITIDTSAMWHLMSEKNYGAGVDRLALATREALQNSRDAIKLAYQKGIRTKEDGKFEITWGQNWDDAQERNVNWVRFKDNGIGMTPQVMRDAFLKLSATTKGGESGGGFGVAKAAILSLSKSFKWRLHSREFVYTADGDITVVAPSHAEFFYQGVDLLLEDVGKEDMGYFYSRYMGQWFYPEDRVKHILGANNLAPQGSFPGVRLFMQGGEIASIFHRRRAKILVKRLETDPKTTITIRAYPRSEDNSGLQYVRLAGLFQFSEPLYGDTPVDLVIDIYTRLAPKHRDYPLPLSRNSISGVTERKVTSIIDEVMTDRLSTLGSNDEEAELLYADAGDLLLVEAAMRKAAERMEAILADPALSRRMKMVAGGGELLRDMQMRQHIMQNRWMEARRRREEAARLKMEADHTSEASWFTRTSAQATRPEAPSKRTDAGLSLQMLQSLQKKKKGRKKKSLANPYAGFAAIRVNRREWSAARLRPYFANPDKWLNLALAWRFACQMVLTELDEEQDFEVGFLFDDQTRAAYVRKDDRRILMINPDWFSRSILKAYKRRPLNIAAVLHAKAAHEVTHLLGYSRHDESFMARREQVADETVGLLYPMAALVEAMLGVKAAPTAEARELAKLRKKLGNRNPTRAALRRHLLRGVRL